MEKYRRTSLLEICFVLLFIINAILIIISIIQDSAVLASAAILFSVTQIFFYQIFERKADILKQFSFGGMMRYIISCYLSPLQEDKTEVQLSSSEKRLISKRCRNISTLLVYQNGFKEKDGYKHIVHYPKAYESKENFLNVNIGSHQCSQPFLMSVLNALTPAIIDRADLVALSQGAKAAGFMLATGPKGLQSEHIRGGADLIWQFQLSFPQLKAFESSEEAVFFRRNASRPYIKMIEFSIAGSAKYRYGMWVDENNRVSFQKEYGQWKNSVEDLSEILLCLSKLRVLSSGKPIGINIPFKDKEDAIALCRAVKQTAVTPDFITLDQACDYTSLAFIKMQLDKFRIESALIYSGQIVSEFEILRTISLGASACITTAPIVQSSSPVLLDFWKGKTVGKSSGIANYHRNTIAATLQLMKLCKYQSLKDVKAESFLHESPLNGLVTLKDIHFPGDKHKLFLSIINN